MVKIIEEEIKCILAAKSGNKEMALFFVNGVWSFDLGNEYMSVNLGEVPGEISVSGESLEDVICKMKIKVGI